MKKILFIFFFAFLFVIGGYSQPKKKIIYERYAKPKQIKLIFPPNQWQFSKSPILINLKWEKPINVNNFTLYIDKFKDGKWVADIIKPNITNNYIQINYHGTLNFRWKIKAVQQNINVLYESIWHYAKYIGSTQPYVKQIKPKFYPVLIEPKNNTIFRNYPRNMTFKWLHSTNPNYRYYQVQIEVFHPRQNKWFPVKYKKGNLLTKNTYLHYNFSADRRGRWHVRGIKRISPRKQVTTPWSQWKYFEFQAKH